MWCGRYAGPPDPYRAAAFWASQPLPFFPFANLESHTTLAPHPDLIVVRGFCSVRRTLRKRAIDVLEKTDMGGSTRRNPLRKALGPNKVRPLHLAAIQQASQGVDTDRTMLLTIPLVIPLVECFGCHRDSPMKREINLVVPGRSLTNGEGGVNSVEPPHRLRWRQTGCRAA